MFQLFETIRVKNNIPENLAFHTERVNRSRRELFKINASWDLQKLISLPDGLDTRQTYRCRFVYDDNNFSTEFIPYSIRPVKSLKVVDAEIDYQHKYLDRSALDLLKKKHTEADDLILVINGKVTDCTYANLVFFDGNQWVTPSTPLLKGTKRQKYLQEQIISERVILSKDIWGFQEIRIINAMIDLDESPQISSDNIKW